MATVLVVAESRNGALRRVAHEATSAARTLADALGAELHAIVLGPPGAASDAAQLGQFGADVVIVVEHDRLSHYDAEAVASTVAARAAACAIVVLSATAQGKDLAPRVAAKLGVPLAADLIAVEARGAEIAGRHPMNTGKVIATVVVSATPAVVSLRPALFAAIERPRTVRIERATLDAAPSRVVVKEVKQAAAGRPDLSDARIIVSGGRGLKAPENFRLVEELASAFGDAAVGCTRAVSDEGWRPHSDQIGQTGRTVSPDLYIAVGISGAIQHIAGMRTAKTIVAINRDREAPIFKVADYGIVGDAFEVVPVLTEAVREAKRTRG